MNSNKQILLNCLKLPGKSVPIFEVLCHNNQFTNSIYWREQKSKGFTVFITLDIDLLKHILGGVSHWAK